MDWVGGGGLRAERRRSTAQQWEITHVLLVQLKMNLKQ